MSEEIFITFDCQRGRHVSCEGFPDGVYYEGCETCDGCERDGDCEFITKVLCPCNCHKQLTAHMN